LKLTRLDVISSGARRRWTLDEKQRVVAESYAAPRQLSATARRNGLSAACLFTKRFEFAGKKIVAGISRVTEPVRLLHRLNSFWFWPGRQVLSLSCGLGWGVEILTRGPIRLLHGRASSYQSRFQARKVKSSKLRNQNRKGSVPLFKVNE
jgi:Transposase